MSDFMAFIICRHYLNPDLSKLLKKKLTTDCDIIKQSSLQRKIDLSCLIMLNDGCESDQEAPHLIRPMNLKRFGPTQEENQRRFWVMTHQMKKRIIEWLKEEKANLKQDIQSKAKKIIEKVDDKSEIYLNINTLLELIECSDSNHRLIQFALILLRTEVAITLKDEDANFFCDVYPFGESLITNISKENYGSEYEGRFLNLGKIKKETKGPRLFFVNQLVDSTSSVGELNVFPNDWLMYDENDVFNDEIEKLMLSSLDEKKKLEVIGEIYWNTYFSMNVVRGAAHNCLVLMSALYEIAFEVPMPPFKEGIMPDLELFQDVDSYQSKMTFIEKFSSKEFFEIKK